jgi:diguanylate cyclase (GGDEF)-like protein
MDERGATRICYSPCRDLQAPAEGTPPATRNSLYLIALDGGIPGEMTLLEPGPNTIGRDSRNLVLLPDPSVSRNHASVRLEPDGLVWLTDLGSTNGTFLNGQRLSPHQPVGLRDGDRLGFGPDRVLKLVLTDPLDERHHRQMFERSVRDPLTDLYNRSYFIDQVERMSRQAFRNELGFAVLMIDIDHFKAINDTFGHEMGDTVLRGVGSVLRQSARADDLVARYGGEEFVVALPIGSIEQAQARGDRMRQGFRALKFGMGERAWTVSASVGVAFAPAGLPASVSCLLRQADEALYRAKRAGRDRTVLYEQALTDDDTGLAAGVGSGQGLTTVDFEAYHA